MTTKADRRALPLSALAAVAAQTLGAAGPAQTIRPEVRALRGSKNCATKRALPWHRTTRRPVAVR